VLLSKRVAGDLNAIFDHIAEDSAQNAASFIGRILDAIGQLRSFPHRTIVEKGRGKNESPVRSLSVKSYVIFFRVDELHNIVRILHVRHGSRHLPRRFE
jgi:plasmid stabilization system protein ParE